MPNGLTGHKPDLFQARKYPDSPLCGKYVYFGAEIVHRHSHFPGTTESGHARNSHQLKITTGQPGTRVCHIGTTGRLQYPADPAVPGYRQDPEPPRTARQRLFPTLHRGGRDRPGGNGRSARSRTVAPSSASADCGSLLSRGRNWRSQADSIEVGDRMSVLDEGLRVCCQLGLLTKRRAEGDLKAVLGFIAHML